MTALACLPPAPNAPPDSYVYHGPCLCKRCDELYAGSVQLWRILSPLVAVALRKALGITEARATKSRQAIDAEMDYVEGLLR